MYPWPLFPYFNTVLFLNHLVNSFYLLKVTGNVNNTSSFYLNLLNDFHVVRSWKCSIFKSQASRTTVLEVKYVSVCFGSLSWYAEFKLHRGWETCLMTIWLVKDQAETKMKPDPSSSDFQTVVAIVHSAGFLIRVNIPPKHIVVAAPMLSVEVDCSLYSISVIN